jgi:glycosyltransferase involved in cell wall biosynthesis
MNSRENLPNPPESARLRIGYFGTWERGYPRNEQVISALRGAGATVTEIHAEAWIGEHKFLVGPTVIPRLVRAELGLAWKRTAAQDLLLVGYPGQFDLWAARRHRLPVAFNAMISLYEAFVDDRRRFERGSVAARALRTIDRRSFQAADLVIADTAANAEYIAQIGSLDRVEHVYVGAEDSLFKHTWTPPDEFGVLFVGKLIPLHGLQLILDAATMLPEIPFTVVGTGQEQDVLRSAPPNVNHVPWVDYRELPMAYANTGCALGIFGPGSKTNRVIPNKVFQALAVGAPVITADTEAARELLTDGKDSLLVERDAEALAAAIRRLADDTPVARALGEGGRSTYEREASEETLGKRWLELLLPLSSAGRRGGRA